MKYSLKIKQYRFKQLLQSVIAGLMVIVLPGIAFGQAPPLPGNGGIPDTPLSVPFDDHLSILLLAAGMILAVVVFARLKKNSIAKAI